jgi:hypothetical protein
VPVASAPRRRDHSPCCAPACCRCIGGRGTWPGPRPRGGVRRSAKGSLRRAWAPRGGAAGGRPASGRAAVGGRAARPARTCTGLVRGPPGPRVTEAFGARAAQRPRQRPERAAGRPRGDIGTPPAVGWSATACAWSRSMEIRCRRGAGLPTGSAPRGGSSAPRAGCVRGSEGLAGAAPRAHDRGRGLTWVVSFRGRTGFLSGARWRAAWSPGRPGG